MPSRRDFIKGHLIGFFAFLCVMPWSGSIAATKKYWLFYAGPENYLFQDGVRDLPRQALWSCQPETRRGDLILVYRRSMNHLTVDDLVQEFRMPRLVATNVKKARIGMDFPVIWEATSNAKPMQQWHWPYGCDTREVRRINPPLPLRKLKAEPRLKEWEDLRLNLQARGRSALEIPEFAWNVISNLIEAHSS